MPFTQKELEKHKALFLEMKSKLEMLNRQQDEAKKNFGLPSDTIHIDEASLSAEEKSLLEWAKKEAHEAVEKEKMHNSFNNQGSNHVATSSVRRRGLRLR